MLPITKPDKKVPTHGPGTTAWYRGKEAKILAIENGKAKIFCDGRVLLVNYTSLDDASFKTLHEAYHCVPATGKVNESEAQDKYQEFFKKKLADYGVSSPAELSAEDKSKFFSEIKKKWPDANMNESIAIPADYQYPLDIANEIGLEGKELALAKKYLGNSAVLLPTYDSDEGKEVKEGLQLKAVLPKAKILGTVGGGRQGGIIAYKFPKGTVAIYVESEYEDPYFLLKPTKSINESLNEAAQNKALFAKVEKWYNALAFDPKSILFYNLFRFSSSGEKIAKKYKTLSQLVKLGSKIVSESGSYKLTGFGIVNAIVAYYSTFKKEADIAARLTSIKMDNSKDYLKYHELAKSTALNEGIDTGMTFVKWNQPIGLK